MGWGINVWRIGLSEHTKAEECKNKFYGMYDPTRTPPARTRYNAQLNFPSLI